MAKRKVSWGRAPKRQKIPPSKYFTLSTNKSDPKFLTGRRAEKAKNEDSERHHAAHRNRGGNEGRNEGGSPDNGGDYEDYGGGEWPGADGDGDDSDGGVDLSNGDLFGSAPPTLTRYALKLQQTSAAWHFLKPALLAVYTNRKAATTNFSTGYSPEIDDCPCRLTCLPETHRKWVVEFIGVEGQFKKEIAFCGCYRPALRLAGLGYLGCTPINPETAFSFAALADFHAKWKVAPMGILPWAQGLFAFHRDREGGVHRARGKGGNERDPGPLLRQCIAIYYEILLMEGRVVSLALEETPRDVVAAKCPACYGPRSEEVELAGQFDVCVSVDGNFSQARNETASRWDFSVVRPEIFLPAKFVDAARRQVQGSDEGEEEAGTLESCAETWKASNDGRPPATYAKKADSGLIGCVCRHGSCLTLINLVKSGERLYYALAILIYLMEEVDPGGRLILFYDIACNFWKHIKNRKLLKAIILANRLLLATAVLHSYSHNKECQMAFSPRLIEGCGYTDGEATERFWAYLSPLIRICRNASSPLRLQNIQFRTTHNNQEKRFRLIRWLFKRLALNQSRQLEASRGLAAAALRGWTVEKLRVEWKAQKLTQVPGRERRAGKTMKEKITLFGSLLLLKDAVKLAARKMKQHFAAHLPNAASINAMHEFVALAEQQNNLQEEIELAQVADLENAEYICKISVALERLHIAVVDLNMMYEPLANTKGGRGAALGQHLVNKLFRAIKAPRSKVSKAITVYDKVVESYIRACAPVNPPALAVSFTRIMSLEADDHFWDDQYFDRPPTAWATSAHCRDGIKWLLQNDRASEELARLTCEVRRAIAWSSTRATILSEKIRLWEVALTEVNQWLRLNDTVLGPVLPLSFNEASETTKLELCHIVLNSLRAEQVRHTQMEERWILDGAADFCRETKREGEDVVWGYLMEMRNRAFPGVYRHAAEMPAREFENQGEPQEEADNEEENGQAGIAAQLMGMDLGIEDGDSE